jgi:competence protein ComFC
MIRVCQNVFSGRTKHIVDAMKEERKVLVTRARGETQILFLEGYNIWLDAKLCHTTVMEWLLGMVAPHSCFVCGDEGAVVCDWCLPDIAPPLPERCYRCKAVSKDSAVCAKCRRGRPLKHVWVRTMYEGCAKQLVHDFKFERKRAAADPIARLMAEALPYLSPDSVLAHIPTAPSRVRQRGYDQAELLARSLARQLGVSHQTILARVTQTRQVGSHRKERLSQMQHAFRVIRPDRFVGLSVVLVDDLTTTGATLEAAARCLRDAGAKSVSAVIFAQR